MRPLRYTADRIPAQFDFTSPVFLAGCAILGVLLVMVGGYGLARDFLDVPQYPLGADLSIYIRASETLPGNIYAQDINTGFDRYGYPPLLAEIFALLNLIVGPTVLPWIWPVLCAASLVASVFVLGRAFGVRLPWQVLVLILGVLSVGVTMRSDIMHGQVNIFMLLLLSVGIYLRAKGQVIAPALLFAIMMSLKPFMGVVAIYFLLRRDWRMAFWTLGLGAAVFLGSFLPMGANALDAFFGWREATHYFTSAPFALKGDSQAIYAMAMRLFTVNDYSTPWIANPLLVYVTVAVASVIAAAFGYLGLYANRGALPSTAHQDRAELLLECMMVVALFMAIGPLTEGDHMILTFAGLAAALIVGMRHIQARSAASPWWIAAIIAWALPAIFLVTPKTLPFTYGTYLTWFNLEGFEILLTGRSGLLMLLAGSLTALTLWRTRKLAA